MGGWGKALINILFIPGKVISIIVGVSGFTGKREEDGERDIGKYHIKLTDTLETSSCQVREFFSIYIKINRLTFKYLVIYKHKRFQCVLLSGARPLVELDATCGVNLGFFR